MNCRLLFWPWVPPQPHTWVFRYGTVVDARSYDAALECLAREYTRYFWASETVPGQWNVQFADDVWVEDVLALDALDAVESARRYITEDASSPTLIYTVST